MREALASSADAILVFVPGPKEDQAGRAFRDCGYVVLYESASHTHHFAEGVDSVRFRGFVVQDVEPAISS